MTCGKNRFHAPHLAFFQFRGAVIKKDFPDMPLSTARIQ
jgi:hypothetical protein